MNVAPYVASQWAAFRGWVAVRGNTVDRPSIKEAGLRAAWMKAGELL